MEIKYYQNSRVIMFQDVDIIFANFSGIKRNKYDVLGNRNFNIIIEDRFVEELVNQGYRIKELESGEFILSVKISNKFSNPEVQITTEDFADMTVEPTFLDFDNIGSLDRMKIVNSSVVIRGSVWDRGDGDVGTSAYLESMLVQIEPDPLRSTYNY